MRLKSIKLAGFKSFVDPTEVFFPGNMSAVVGPNGCGKSNIIDAVRWVMGESSAKNLRGESMADVIFNGSGDRQPVGQASIELVFDNSSGKVGGEFARYSEISTRRVVSREGQSEYYLNGTRCRRRDITDIFLGTGLGPRSYAIIEQGMISRLVESKPEELRVFIEEAAGISKYKERRRETESRMRRTVENLERLTDLRDELQRQLQHLERQANAADKYKDLKRDERSLKQRLLAARWRDLSEQSRELAQEVGDEEVRLEKVYAEQQAVSTRLEEHRVTQSERNDAVAQAQQQFYSVGAEVSRIEQEIRYQSERAEQLAIDLEATESGLSEARQHLEDDGQRLEAWESELSSLSPALDSQKKTSLAAVAALNQLEADMQGWQGDWDAFNERATGPQQQAEVQQSRIQHLERSLSRLVTRIEQLSTEQSPEQGSEPAILAELTETHSAKARVAEDLANRCGEVEQRRNTLRNEKQVAETSLADTRQALAVSRGRISALEVLLDGMRKQAEGDGADRWLNQQGLGEAPRLLSLLEVEPAWQQSVEMVLGSVLQAVCVPELHTVAKALPDLQEGELAIIEDPLVDGASSLDASDFVGDTLDCKVTGDGANMVRDLLRSIRCVSSLDEAERLRSELAPGQSIIVPAGIWMGRHWARGTDGDWSGAGVLEHQRELDGLRRDLKQQTAREAEAVAESERTGQELQSADETLRRLRGELDSAQAEKADALASMRAEDARQKQAEAEQQRRRAELAELTQQQRSEQEAIVEARGSLEQAIEAMERDRIEREERMSARTLLTSALESARGDARRLNDETQQAALRHQSLLTQSQTIRGSIERTRTQVNVLERRREDLRSAQDKNQDPGPELQQKLEQQLAQRVEAEGTLTTCRQALSDIEHTLREEEQERMRIEQRATGVREQLEAKRLTLNGYQHQQSTYEAQLEEAGASLEDVLAMLPEDVVLPDWESELERIANRIARLGPINLAAIDEYKQQAERKTYLDAQNEDLESALETLEAAIRKIDRETRNRFKETFDQVNSGLQELFPKVFGGGSAHLEMTGDDLLDTGVAIMARPPGKKNSTIHLLSGGEKALTAIALVFSIFQLNPAPFCMLDEVDAPLDDANVGRYARMVREMSEKVQFVFITHNKITMEMADQLMGVTMQEPGVSRLVSVNVGEAAELAAS
ncbi:MAG: chromosome segregation protein SMC [Pseudomonadota bacterium]